MCYTVSLLENVQYWVYPEAQSLTKANISCVVRHGFLSLLIGCRIERSDNLSILQPINKLEKPYRKIHKVSA